MLRIGLTGGIGSGKSTVAEGFAALGVPVIDTDRIAHRLVEPGQPALEQIVQHFGPPLRQADGHLNRKLLAQKVFAEPAARAQLEAILHPLIRHAMHEQLKGLGSPYCILVIPLLLESGWQDEVDRILVVDLPRALQLKRVQARDDRPIAEIEAIINIQATREQRLAAADDIIDNSQGSATLEQQIARLHQRYLELAGPKS